MIGSVLVGMLVFGGFFHWAYRKRIHPILAWLVIAIACFTFSQTFPENRTQKLQLAVGLAIGSAVLVWLVFRALQKSKRSAVPTTPPPNDAEISA